MRRTLLIISVLVAAVAVCLGAAVAQGYGMAGKAGPPDGAPCMTGARPGMGPGPGFGFGFGPGLLRGVDLTEDQVQQLNQLREQFQADTQDLRNQIQAKHQELRKLWAADQPDTAAIKAVIAQIEPLETELAYERVDHQLQVLNILTEQQRQSVRERLQAGPGPGAGGGFGPGVGPAQGTCPFNGAGMRKGCCPRG